MNKKHTLNLVIMPIDITIFRVYNKAINKTKQPNNSKSCEAENHIPVRGQAVSPIVRKMSQPVVIIKEKGI